MAETQSPKDANAAGKAPAPVAGAASSVAATAPKPAPKPAAAPAKPATASVARPVATTPPAKPAVKAATAATAIAAGAAAIAKKAKISPTTQEFKDQMMASAKKSATKSKPKTAAKKSAAPKKVAPKKATAKSNGDARGRAPTYGDDMKITLKVKDNPKREGSASFKRYAKYKTGMSVAEALKAGLTYGDFRYDVASEFISIR